MKKLFFVAMMLMSIHAFAQTRTSKNTIFQQASEKLKRKNIDPKLANMEEWEVVLKEVGTVTKLDNSLMCKGVKQNNLTLNFKNNQMVGLCETFEMEKAKGKKKK